MSGEHPILMLAYYFPPAIASGGARPYRFYKNLPRYGYEPHVITASMQDTERPLERVCFVRDASWPPGYQSARSFVELLVRRTLFDDDGVSWTLPAARAARALIRRESIPLLYSTFPPINTHLVALWLKKRYGLRWVADFRDPLVGNLARTKARLRRWMDPGTEALIFRHADALIANTDVVAEKWCARYPQYREKIRVIWNGFDPEESLEMAPPARGGREVLAHVGSLYGSRKPDLLLSALGRLTARGDLAPERILLKLIGPMSHDSAPLDSPPVRTLLGVGCLERRDEQVPREEASRIVAESGRLLVLDLLDANAGLQVPAKLFDYVRLGKPILAFTKRSSPVDRILSRCGVPNIRVYSVDAEAEIDRKVLSFFHLPADPVRASDWFWNEFDGQRQTRTLAGILASVLSTASPAEVEPYCAAVRNDPVSASPPQPT